MTGGVGGAKIDIAEKIAKLKVKSKTSGKEGFTPANTNFGQSSPYLLSSMGGHSTINTNDWNQKDLTIRNGKFGNGVAEILNRPSPPLPLPEGEMLLFANIPFKPDCCKNNSAYSNSMGCACISDEVYNYLKIRGGNNLAFSEY
jgi:hypothetical protein